MSSRRGFNIYERLLNAKVHRPREHGDRAELTVYASTETSFTDASASGLAGQTLMSRLAAPDTLSNTFYLDAALRRLRADGYPVGDQDPARLSPYMRRHSNVQGHHSFHPPDLGGAPRPLRDPNARDDEPV